MRTRFRILLMVAIIGLSFDADAVSAANDDGSEPSDQAARAGPFNFFVFTRPLGLVTFMKSRSTDPLRTATVVSVTNQAKMACTVSVAWFRGFDATPVCTTTLDVNAGFQADFCSRAIPDALTTCNVTCSPDLTFHEGTATVSTSVHNPLGLPDACDALAVSARVYYTTDVADLTLAAVTDSKIVRIDEGNRGD